LLVGELQQLTGQVGDGLFAIPDAGCRGSAVQEQFHERLAVAGRAAVARRERAERIDHVADVEHPPVKRLGQETAGVVGRYPGPEQVGQGARRGRDGQAVGPGHLVRREYAVVEFDRRVAACPASGDRELHAAHH